MPAVAMPKLTRKARKALVDERRQQILDAAIRVFADRGFAGATVRDVARAARVAEGTIYIYFKSKEDLLIHIPRQIAAPVIDRLEAQLAAVRTPAEAEAALVALGEAIVTRLSSHVRFVKVFLSALPHLSARARDEYLRQFAMAVWETIEHHLRQGAARGLYRPDLVPGIAARVLPGMWFMFVVFQEILIGNPRARFAYDTVVRENVRLFLGGALADGRGVRTRGAGQEG
jgi:TetR/AcrR family fatty acid metabolism transcriptional regulator